MVFIPTDDGRWVNSDFERLARVIQDYDAELQLMWIPPEHRTREDKAPYIVVDTRTQTPVLHASELDTPEQILARLFAADGKNGNVLKTLEAHNAAIEAMKMREYMDWAEEAQEQTKFLMGSPLHWVNFNGRKLDSSRRPC